MKINLLLLIAVACCISCNPVLKTIYGVKQPEYESSDAIDQKIAELEMPDAIHCNVDADLWIENRLLMMPEVFVFTGDGKFISYKDTVKPNCNGPAEVFLAELSNEKKYYYSDGPDMNAFIKNLECGELSFKKGEQVDFVIFITWAKWSGNKIYRDKTQHWLNSLKGNKHITYELVMVNQDLQEKWDGEDKKRLDGRIAK